MENSSAFVPALDKPIFTPTYLNLEYVFSRLYDYGTSMLGFVTNTETWSVLGVISISLSIFFIAIIVFSLVRMIEIQIHEDHEIKHEIHEALMKTQERERNDNPRWKYILTLMQSPNESDWRIAIMDADSLLEDALKDRGLSGETVSDLLDGAKESGYRFIQDAWDAHIVRNKIAHEGTDYPLSQIEARKTLKMFENFFEEIGVL